MSLPEQIQKQVEEAKTIIAQHYGPETDDALGVPGGQAESEASSHKVTSSTEAEGSAAQPQAPAYPPAENENSESYAQRCRSLQGIYNATVQKAQQQEARLQQMEQLIATIQATPTAPAQQTPGNAASYITSKDEEDYGVELVDMSRRAAREEQRAVQDELAAMRNELAHLRAVVPVVNRVAQAQQMSSEERFFAALGQLVPDYQQVNVNQRFHEWLLTPDPMTGITRQTYLEDAQRASDAPRVASIFNSWKESTGTVAPQGVQSAPASRKSAVSELERQVAPGKVTAGNTPNTSQSRVWTPADISKFYEETRKGVYKGREQERAETERDIFLAQREGRIRQHAA